MRHVSVFVLGMLVVLSGCGRSSVSQSSQARAARQREFADEYNAELMRQLKQGAEQLRKSAEQQVKVNEQDRRYDSILGKWEEQQQRIDAFLERWEQVLGKFEGVVDGLSTPRVRSPGVED